VAGDALNFGVIKAVYDYLVVGTQQPELCIDGAGGAALGPADDPYAEENHGQHSNVENKPNPSQDVLALFFEVGGALVEIVLTGIVRPSCDPS
jgi:hypothetical protein